MTKKTGFSRITIMAMIITMLISFVFTSSVYAEDFMYDSAEVKEFNDFEYIVEDNKVIIDDFSSVVDAHVIPDTIPASEKNIVIPKKIDGLPVVRIDASAFKYCEYTESVLVPEYVESIGVYAFRSCTALETITLNNKLSFVEEGAFSDCPELKTVYYTGTEEEWNNINFAYDNDAIIDAEIVYNYVPPVDDSEDIEIEVSEQNKEKNDDGKENSKVIWIVVGVAGGAMIAAVAVVIVIKSKSKKANPASNTES